MPPKAKIELTTSAAILILAVFLALEFVGNGDSRPMNSNPQDGGASKIVMDLRQQAESLVESITHGQARVEGIFTGPDRVTGLVLATDGGRAIGWMLPGGQNLVMGPLLDAGGTDLTEAAYQDRIVGSVGKAREPDLDGPSLLAVMGDLPRLTLGGGDKILYVFADVNCPYCGHLFQELRQDEAALKKEGIEVRWLIVSVLGERSLNQGAYLLSLDEKDRVEALGLHHTKTKLLKEEPASDLKAIVAKGYQYMDMIVEDDLATPALVWWDAQTSKIGLYMGAPPQEDRRKVFQRLAALPW